MKKLFLLVVVFFTLGVNAQDSIYTPVSNLKHSISAEIGGVGFLYSLNYERLYYNKFKASSFLPNSAIGLRVGITQLTNFSEDNINVTRINLISNFNFGKKKWFAEMGLGLAPTIEDNFYVDFVATINTKYQSIKGFCVKFGFIAGRKIDKYYFDGDKSKNYYFPSVSFGYSF